jgi:hypothetical protein
VSEHTSHTAVEVGTERSFGVVFAIVFLIIGLWPLMGERGPRWWAIAIAAVFLVSGFLFPKLLKPLNWLWFKFGMLLGAIIAPIVMSLIYFIAVVPTGLIMRARGKDLLNTRLDPDAESYWIPREGPPGSMKNQF